MTITSRQGQFLAFILRFTQRYGVSPSFDEIAAHFGITSPSVNGMIRTLERKGLVSRIPGAARTLRVEVSADSLPDIDFGRTPRSKIAECQRESHPSTLAASAAIAVLDAVMPLLLSHGVTPDEASRAVQDSAAHVREALARNGLSSEEALTAARLVAAELSRWQPDRRGISVPRYIWKRH